MSWYQPAAIVMPGSIHKHSLNVGPQCTQAVLSLLSGSEPGSLKLSEVRGYVAHCPNQDYTTLLPVGAAQGELGKKQSIPKVYRLEDAPSPLHCHDSEMPNICQL